MKKTLSLALVLLMVLGASAKIKVHTIGDSTMSNYKPSATVKRGWGMYLQAYLDSALVEVNNRGKSGASTRTFYETEALWPSVKAQVRPGDYVIIQFAHNDEKCKGQDVYVYNDSVRALGQDTTTDMRGTHPHTTYKMYLRRLVEETRALGATPVLMAPICRKYFTRDGRINDEGRHILKGGLDYVQSMREVADEMQVVFVDMTSATRDLYESMGDKECTARYFGAGDKTHTTAEGGRAIAALAAQQLRSAGVLTDYIIEPSDEALRAYCSAIENAGLMAAMDEGGLVFSNELTDYTLSNLRLFKHGFAPESDVWGQGEIDEVATRYIDYALTAPQGRAIVLDKLVFGFRSKGGDGMNLHINYGLGDAFQGVTTIYENTALRGGKTLRVELTQPILVPAGTTLHLRVLPWYDTETPAARRKYLHVDKIQVHGRLMFKK